MATRVQDYARVDIFDGLGVPRGAEQYKDSIQMNANELEAALNRLGACYEARDWSQGKTLENAWNSCERGDWLLWLAAKARVDRRLVVRAACACARTALRFIPADEKRPLAAIELAERWTENPGSVESKELRGAADAAYAACADDAACAAYAAYAYDAAYDAAHAAADAAYDAAYAAYAAADAAYAYDRTTALAECARLVRGFITHRMVEGRLAANGGSIRSGT